MEWFKRIGLSTRIVSHISLILLITLFIGAVAIWQAVSFQRTIDNLVRHNISMLQAAREMQNALANQKGYVTYFFLDGDSKWLQELAVYRMVFEKWLLKAHDEDTLPDHTALLNRIRDKYHAYTSKKDRVIELYKKGDRSLGENLHWEVRGLFSELNDLTLQYKNLNEEAIARIQEEGRRQTSKVSSAVILSLIVSVILGVFLGFMLIVQVLGPIRRLARIVPSETEGLEPPANEVKIMSSRFRGLIDDIDRTRGELRQSKEMLLNSEKMTLVGRLATEVAHSIRNPMTSINMRLFSLQRNLEMSPNQKEDLEVVAEEMQRLDGIVRNFLEFSRPHKLQKQSVQVPEIIDMAVDLLEYRLELHSVEVVHNRPPALSSIEADPELLKEVFLNLIVNACEASGNGGRIYVTEKDELGGPLGRAVRIRISDTGPGIPEGMREKVFEPFVTTKTDGTGLGLFTVTRIVLEHGGRIDLEGAPGEGAVFVITLPVAGGKPHE